SYFINTFSDVNTPYLYTLHESKTGKQLREIKNNNILKNKLSAYAISPKVLSTIRINGEDLNMYMIKPINFDSNKNIRCLCINIQVPDLRMYRTAGWGPMTIGIRCWPMSTTLLWFVLMDGVQVIKARNLKK